ncbi:MAG: transposase, partial [Terriglobales bacterium]
ILFALWLYATLEGVGSGREVARLSREHDAYRWICGSVSVNYHALNDFRAHNDALMDELLTDNVAALAAVGAISLERVAQDGMRVRADAGAASFRRQASLEEHLGQARELVQTIKAQAQADPGRARRQAQAAKLRAAQEREARIGLALAQLPEVAAARKRNGGKAEEARASTTDADARVMKMGDGGFRPAYNVQFAATCDEQVIVGLDVVNTGSDMAQLAPMVEQVEQRLGRTPGQWLVDGGFPAHEQIDAVADRTEVYAPVPEPRARKDDNGEEVPQDKHQRKPDDSEAVAQWRQRMAGPAAREIYKQRAATAECVNALARNRGLLRMPVRGRAKVRSVVGLFALAHNLLRMAVLAPQLIGWGTDASGIRLQAA